MSSLIVGVGTQVFCSFGSAPGVVPSASTLTVMVGGAVPLSISDFRPLVNIPSFGLCRSPANPAVASATAANRGTLTPMPCIPSTTAPWAPGSPTVLVASLPAVTNTCKCQCAWGGVVSVAAPNQATVTAP